MAQFKLKYREIEYVVEEAESIRIGRSPESRIVIDDPRVSENHCEIVWDPNSGASIRDLGSTNATIILRKKRKILVGRRPENVNREKAHTAISEDMPLHSGDRIRLFSECIIDVEYSINATRVDEDFYFGDKIDEEACKDGKAVDGEKTRDAENVRRKEECCREEKLYRDEDIQEDEKYTRKTEENPLKNEDDGVEDAKRTSKNEEESGKFNGTNSDNVTKKGAGAKTESTVIKLAATVRENTLEDYETEWGNSLVSRFKENYKMDRLYMSSFTELWIATPLKWNEDSEIKVIKIFALSKDVNSETAGLLFEREKKIAPQLHHPNIIKTYKAGRSGNQQYIMMEYCKHGNLADFVSDRGLHRLPEKMAIKIIVQVLKGLTYFHYPPFRIEYDDRYRRTLKDGAKQLVHRDIKPMNLLVRSVDQNGEPEIVISDFGLAKDSAIGGSSEITKRSDGTTTGPNEIRATLAFAPYEQIKDPVLVNTGVDIWSTFAVLFWLLTEETPRDMDGCNFDKTEDKCQLKTVMKYFESNHVRKIHSIRSDVSPELAELIDAILSTDQSVHEYSKEEELDLIHKIEGML